MLEETEIRRCNVCLLGFRKVLDRASRWPTGYADSNPMVKLAERVGRKWSKKRNFEHMSAGVCNSTRKASSVYVDVNPQDSAARRTARSLIEGTSHIICKRAN